jgi:hypothetical protein
VGGVSAGPAVSNLGRRRGLGVLDPISLVPPGTLLGRLPRLPKPGSEPKGKWSGVKGNAASCTTVDLGPAETNNGSLRYAGALVPLGESLRLGRTAMSADAAPCRFDASTEPP